MPDPDPKVLEHLLLLWNALHSAPDDTHLGEETCHALLEIPGLVGDALLVGEKTVAKKSRLEPPLTDSWLEPAILEIESQPGKNGYHVVTLPLQTNRQSYGRLAIAIKDHDAFLPYLPYLQNTASLIALKMETHQQSAELNAAFQTADSANRAKSVFLANMSHEMRTPLNAILGYSQLLLRDATISPTQSEFTEIIQHSGNNLLNLINDLLEIAKIEAGQAEVSITTFDFHNFLKDLEAVFRLRADAKEILLTFDPQGEVAHYLKTDERKLRQILNNILSNAVKFTDRGGIIMRVKTEERTSGAVRVSMEVEDTGFGIAAEEISKVFTRFEQTESGRKLGGGTGLGMALSREYARLLGCDISVKSLIGCGSTFHFEFDAQLGSESEIIKTSVQTRRVLQIAQNDIARRILVVDDISTNRRPLVQLLLNVGFQVREAADGLEAIEVFTQWHPDIIFMDVMMPKLDGVNATRRLKATDQGARTPIFLLTASVVDNPQSKVLEAGADGFVNKPYDAEEIFQLIHEATGVNYLYEGRVEKSLVVELPAVNLDRQLISELPNEMKSAMCQALGEGDVNCLIGLIDQTAERWPQVAKALQHLANRYEYDTLRSLLEMEVGELVVET